MRKLPLFFALGFLATGIAWSQDILVADWDTQDPDEWSGWDATFGKVENPDKTGINTSDSCGMWVKATGTWKGQEIATWTQPDLYTYSLLEFKLLAPKPGEVFMKLYDTVSSAVHFEGWDAYWPADEWTTVTVDFYGLVDTGVYKIQLFLDPNDTIKQTFYFDDLTFKKHETVCAPATLGDVVVADFDETKPPVWYGWDNQPSVVENPDKDACLNPSDSCGMWVKSSGTWKGLGIQLGDLQLGKYDSLEFKAWFPSPGEVFIQIQDTATSSNAYERHIAISDTGRWFRIVHYFYGLDREEIYKIQLFFNPNSEEEMTFYIDDIALYQDYTVQVPRIRVVETKIFPNPVVDVLYLKDAGDIRSLDIYSITGARIRSFGYVSGSQPIPVSDLRSGLYLLNIRNKDGSVSTHKFIKQ